MIHDGKLVVSSGSSGSLLVFMIADTWPTSVMSARELCDINSARKATVIDGLVAHHIVG